MVIPAHHIRSYRQAMNETHASPGSRHEAGEYEIRLQGHLDAHWATWFDGLGLTNESGGTTLIHGHVTDQAALHGLLQKVRDVGLPLISAMQVGPAKPDASTTDPDRHSTFLKRRPS